MLDRPEYRLYYWYGRTCLGAGTAVRWPMGPWAMGRMAWAMAMAAWDGVAMPMGVAIYGTMLGPS
eukprot:SAG31_NODE_854_length_11497_cov_8.245043_1_plen_65_part_00